MTGPLMPDPEAIVTTYLAGAIGETRITDGRPKNIETAWVAVTLLDASPIDTVTDYLAGALMQFDCYAGASGNQHREASQIARTVRAALRDIATADPTDAVVTGARIVGYSRVPDTGLDPARQRYVITAEVYIHAPAPQPAL